MGEISIPEECLFCRILSGKEKSWIVYRDKSVMALLDPYPVTIGHTLVIPVQHHESMFDIPDPLLRKVISISRKLCIVYKRTLKIQGVSIEVMNHRHKRPEYSHFHLHVIPRYDKNARNDPSNVKPNKKFPRESDENLAHTLNQVRVGIRARSTSVPKKR